MAFDIFVMKWPIITSDTPIEEVFEIHRRIWDEVLRTYEITGRFLKPRTPYIYNCALCTYALFFARDRNRCEMCPADWGEYGICEGLNSLYRRIIYSVISDPEEMIDAVKAIRGIKPKEELINGKH